MPRIPTLRSKKKERRKVKVVVYLFIYFFSFPFSHTWMRPYWVSNSSDERQRKMRHNFMVIIRWSRCLSIYFPFLPNRPRLSLGSTNTDSSEEPIAASDWKKKRGIYKSIYEWIKVKIYLSCLLQSIFIFPFTICSYFLTWYEKKKKKNSFFLLKCLETERTGKR